MIGLPHLVQGTVANGARSPGMKTLVSHQPQVTIRRGSLMLWNQSNTMPQSDNAFFNPKMDFDKPRQIVFPMRC
jgi:hypothetical protein